MMRRPRLVGACFVVALASFSRQASSDEQGDLEKGRSAFLARRYDEADARFRAMLNPRTGTLHDSGLVSLARMYWASVMLAQNRPVEASGVLEMLILDDPQFEPDPLSFPSEAINTFIDTRSRIRDRLNAAAREAAAREAARRASEEAHRKLQAARMALLEQLATHETVVERHSRFVALIPFGVGQFQNGQKALGWTFLLTEVALLGVAGACVPWFNVEVQRASDEYASGRNYAAQQYIDRANDVRLINIASYVAFAVTAGLGVLHAQLTYVPDRIEIRRRPLPPVAVTPTITPSLGREAKAGGAFFGLEGRF